MEQQVPGVGVNFYLRDKGKYKYLIVVVCENGKCQQRDVANVEALYIIAEWFRNRGMRLTKRNAKKIIEQFLEGKCPNCRCEGEGVPRILAGPGGFEPPTTGLGGQRSVLAELRALLFCWPPPGLLCGLLCARFYCLRVLLLRFSVNFLLG